MSDTRQPYHILGRLAGTATGWDQQDTFAMTLYDFEPAKGCTIPATNNLLIDFEEGTYEGGGRRQRAPVRGCPKRGAGRLQIAPHTTTNTPPHPLQRKGFKLQT